MFLPFSFFSFFSLKLNILILDNKNKTKIEIYAFGTCKGNIKPSKYITILIYKNHNENGSSRKSASRRCKLQMIKKK